MQSFAVCNLSETWPFEWSNLGLMQPRSGKSPGNEVGLSYGFSFDLIEKTVYAVLF